MKSTLHALAVAFALALPAAAEDTAEQAYAKAVEKEEKDRDLNGAMEMYREIVKKHLAEEEIAAKAQLRLAECWEKLGVAAEAKQAYEAVIRDFPSQTAAVDRAKERLAALAGQEVVAAPEDVLAKKLATTKIDLDFTEAPLSDILEFLSEFGGINVVVDVKIADEAARARTFAVKDLALEKVLNLLAATGQDLGWANWRGALVWSTPARLAELKQAAGVAQPGGNDDADRKVWQSLQAIRISLSFSEMPLEDALGFVREVAGMNILLMPGCPEAKVTLKLAEARLVDAMDLLAWEHGLKLEIREGCLQVSAR
jgi:hypothetical protein